MPRLEFSKKVKIEIFKRAGGPGELRCERCVLAIKGRNFEIDHTIEEWILEDIALGLRGPLTAEDGKLLCIPCHDEKSRFFTAERAKVKRVVERASKAERRKGRPMAGSKASGWKKPMHGPAHRRDK